MKATGTNTESSTSVMAMIGAKIWPIAILVASRGRQLGMVLHHLLDRLDHHDRIVHDDADGEHDRQQRDGVGRIADRVQHDERADQADRNRDRGDQRGAQVAKEQVDDQHDQDERLDQRLLHLVDRGGDERRRDRRSPSRPDRRGNSAPPSAMTCLTPPSAVSALAPGD